MPTVNSEMECPGCGASVSLQDKECAFCGRKLTFTSLNFKEVRRTTFKESAKFLNAYKNALKGSPDNPEVLASLGYVLLDRGQYEEAADALDKACGNGADDPDVLFQAALAHFKTKKPFQIKLKEAESIIARLDSAITMEARPQYLFAKAQLINLLFERRFVRYRESSASILRQADAAGLTDADRTDIESLLAAK